jgi:hypothetical protein
LKAEAEEAKWDNIYRAMAVIGTIVFITIMMVKFSSYTFD